MKLLFKNFTLLTLDENKELLEIRNSDYVRFNMENMQEIKLENHLIFIKSLKNDDNLYFAVISDSEIIGAIYINKKNGKVFFGVYFKSDINPFISSSSTFIFFDYIFFNISKTLFSYIKKQNLKAFYFNKNFGFELYKEDENYFYLELGKEKWENRKNSKLLKSIKKYLDKIEYQFS